MSDSVRPQRRQPTRLPHPGILQARMKPTLGRKGYILNPNRWFEDYITRNTHCRHQGSYLSSENQAYSRSDSQIMWHEIFSKHKNQQVAQLTYKEQIQKCKLKAAELENVGSWKGLYRSLSPKVPNYESRVIKRFNSWTQWFHFWKPTLRKQSQIWRILNACLCLT